MAKVLGKARSTANALAKTPISTGKLVDFSVDDSDRTFTSAAFNAPRPNPATYGAFLTAAVAVWVYLIDIVHSAAKALDVGDSLADVSTPATANGTMELATTIGSATAASLAGYDSLASQNSSMHDWSFAFGAPRGDTTVFRDNFQIVDANAGDDIATGRDDFRMQQPMLTRSAQDP